MERSAGQRSYPRLLMLRTVLLLCPVLVCACKTSKPDFPLTPIHRPLVPPTTSIEGRPLEYEVIGEGDETMLVIAGIHGDERAGVPLAKRFVDELGLTPELVEGKRVVVVPIANPDGFSRNSRRNARGIDLNRNFPASNYVQTTGHGEYTLSEPEAMFLYRLVQHFEPELIISFHQPADRIDYDGPGAAFAFGLAGVSDLEVKRMGGRHGSLGSWAGEDNEIAVVTIELPREADELTDEEAWESYGQLLLHALLMIG